MTPAFYTKQYYEQIGQGAAASAKEMIPVLLQFVTPSSVVDIGCGTGHWLLEWEKAGIKEYYGVDGDHIRLEQLVISPHRFIQHDLEKSFTLPQRFDLVMSLEVAEHLQPGSAKDFIRSLTNLGDLVLFSAAIPGQGGVSHVNEQYPGYWADLFRKYGFSCYDCLRERIWLNNKIDTCYRQNVLFFVKDEVKERYPSITQLARPLLPVVHPEHFVKKEQVLDSYKKVLRTPFHAGWHFIKAFFRLFRK